MQITEETRRLINPDKGAVNVGHDNPLL
jgi:hypothetical protein